MTSFERSVICMKPLCVDGRHIAGVEPAVGIENAAALAAKVLADDAGSAHEQASEGGAVLWEAVSVVVDDFHLDAEGSPPLFDLDVEARFERQFVHSGHGGAERSKGAHFGHAPSVDDVDLVVALEGGDHGARHGGAANDDAIEAGQFGSGFLEVRKEHHPHGGHGGGERDLVVVEEFADAVPVHVHAGHDEFGSGGGGHVDDAPCVGVEHGDDGEDGVAGAHSESVGLVSDERVEDV